VTTLTACLAERAAHLFLCLAQSTPFRGNRNRFCSIVETKNVAQGLPCPQAILEAAGFPDFVRCFGRYHLDVRGLAILDLGCGYGGKTIEFARQLGARHVVGVEPHERMVELCVQYAASLSETRCEFRRCGQVSIPAEDHAFDAVVSHDVMEHVHDPRATLAEMRRVLRPGGVAYVVFTPYWGALAHHLGYVTRLPGVHWVFSAQSLVGAVNRILAGPGGDRYNTGPQPRPGLSFDGKFEVLPTLNGLGGAAFTQLAASAGFGVEWVDYPTIVSRFKPEWRWADALNAMPMRVHPCIREALSFNMACVLRRG
jgi:SAM-dependent methyltransferase